MKKKIISLLLAITATCSIAFGGCGKKEQELKIDPKVDYSTSNLQFDFYGYSGPSYGKWSIDGVTYSADEDFRTVERMQEYKDVGMTIYLPQDCGNYNGQEEWDDSWAKKCFDNAHAVGIDKVILTDNRIQNLSYSSVGLIGEGKQFATEADLDKQIAEYMAPYKDHPAFYGVMLGDEPSYERAEAYGQIYRSLKRVAPNCFAQYNLLPISAGKYTESNDRIPMISEEEAEGKTDMEIVVLRYQKYLRMFLDSTGANYVQYDQYPLGKGVDDWYIIGLQVVAAMAKEYDIDFYFVSQTMGRDDANAHDRILKEADLYWINNMLLGFGIKQISYFTYWTKANNDIEHFTDGGSFITRYGEKTDIYYAMQHIMAEEQKLAPTILNFDYETCKVYIKSPTNFNANYLANVLPDKDFTCITDVEINKECTLVTELYDKDRDNYMYMVQNVIDPQYLGSKTYQTATVTFDAKYTKALVWFKGEAKTVKLDNGKLILKQMPGEATFVLPC